MYVLYRDDHPYYVGKTGGSLFDRIWHHAIQSHGRYYNLWNSRSLPGMIAAFAWPSTMPSTVTR